MPGKRLNSKAQELVLNALAYFEREKENGGPLLPLSAVYEKVSEALGVSRQTVWNLKKRKLQNPVSSLHPEKRPRIKPKTRDLRETTKMEVRNTIYNMYQQRKHVTLQTLKDELKTKGIIELCKQSLSTLLKEIGFKYRKEDNRRSLIEKHDIALLRSVFLKKYMANLSSSSAKQVVFLDETWIYSKGTQIKSWQDDTAKSVRKPQGYDGKRFMIVHAGSEHGFINGASLIFASTSKAADYHSAMDSKKFEEWVTKQLIPNLPPNSLVVMDNAPYHSVVINKIPNSSSKKQDIADWLRNNGMNFSSESTKMELLDIVRRNKPEKKYAIDELIKCHGHEVLRLPPYHCDFNAIELIWASAKRYYNQNIGRDGYRDQNVLNMWNEALQHCTPNTWENCVRHTNNLIKSWYEREKKVVEMDIEPIIIVNPNESSSSEEDTDN